jgi:hypothetical protein
VDELNESRPFNAYEGGAKVLGAINEVLSHGGSVGKALQCGENALRDLRAASADTHAERQDRNGLGPKDG